MINKLYDLALKDLSSDLYKAEQLTTYASLLTKSIDSVLKSDLYVNTYELLQLTNQLSDDLVSCVDRYNSRMSLLKTMFESPSQYSIVPALEIANNYKKYLQLQKSIIKPASDFIEKLNQQKTNLSISYFRYLKQQDSTENQSKNSQPNAE